MGSKVIAKAQVRRRTFEKDDAYWEPEDRWPPQYTWVCDIDYYEPDGRWRGGVNSPHTSHALALQEAFAVTRREETN